MQLNKSKFLILSSIGVSIGLMISYCSKIQSSTYYLNITCKSNNHANCQVFYDIGGGYIERHSNKKLLDQNKTGEVNFKIPAKKIYGLRFDPMDTNGSIEVKKISIMGKKKLGDQHKILHEFDLRTLKPVQQVDLAFNKSGNLIATTHNECNDPIIDLPLEEHLDHWSKLDFLDMEWFQKSVFFAFLVTPINLALSLSKKEEKDFDNKIRFEIKKVKHSIGLGESFSARPENCYQDTKEENIRFIIEEIKNGTHWKKAVKEKFQKANPWLYEIVTSPKRTKFIDEFVKPKDLQILDIGAGWGQFTLPLAKQNKICSLEPTPERLDFIKTASRQEKVSKNISFIGADYLDIKFENKFDLILSIGVLEWVGAFRSRKEPEDLQLDFLKKIKSELKENGKLIIGIENRLGLKYLLGAPDDHIGHPNITIYEKELAKKLYKEKTNQELRSLTHSIAEYKDMLLDAGFNKINFYTSTPDYKLPVKIFPIKANQCKLNEHILKEKWIKEHDGTNGNLLNKQSEIKSLAKSMANLNTLHNFAPSYFIECS
ncbi:class I SAM-dependent methyltransferase [Opitutales bacterium]|nr:class I SAM-dependent methyltransferase [Opitutales bacterium]